MTADKKTQSKAAYATLPSDKHAERSIVATLVLMGADRGLWEICKDLEPDHFLDVSARDIFKKMKDTKSKGRMWTEKDFDIVTDPAGNVIPPVTSFELTEMARRLYDAKFFRDRVLWAGQYAKACNAGDIDEIRELDQQRLSLYAFEQDGRSPVTWADQVSILPSISWLWEKWLPVGFASMIIGAPEIGKSALMLGLARSVIIGSPWPNGQLNDQIGRVVWYDTENAEAINHQRAEWFGIPLDSILVPSLEHDPLSDVDILTTEGWASFEIAVRSRGVRLAVVDSLGGSYMRENDPQVKGLMKRLGALARDSQVAIVIIHHPRKLNLGEHDVITLDRIRGHSGIIQFARVITAIEKPDPLSQSIRAKVIKSNFGEKPEPFGFEWVDNQLIYSDAPEEVKQETQRDRAVDLLLVLLKSGPMRATDIYSEADGAGISKNTVKRAKKALNLGSFKKADGWYWSLPSYREKP